MCRTLVKTNPSRLNEHSQYFIYLHFYSAVIDYTLTTEIMISVDQWRAAIGCFSPRREKLTPKPVSININNGQLFSIGVKIFIIISLCIILSGDVETNPGPTYEQILNELKAMRRDNNQHFKDLRDDISLLKSDINMVNEKVNRLTSDIDYVYDECYGEIQSLKSNVKRLEDSVESQARYSRRDNLIFHDIPCDENENNEKTRKKLIQILNDNVTNKTWTNDDFVRVHRLKSKQSAKQPIIARLVRTEDKFSILSARQNLRDGGYGVANDLTPVQRAELHTLRQQGKKAFYKSGRLIVDQSQRSSDSSSQQQQTEVDTDERPNFRFGTDRGRGIPTLKDKGIGVANDLTRNQRSELQTLKDKGQRGYYKNGQHHIDNNKQNQPKERSYLTGARRLGNNK